MTPSTIREVRIMVCGFCAGVWTIVGRLGAPMAFLLAAAFIGLAVYQMIPIKPKQGGPK